MKNQKIENYGTEKSYSRFSLNRILSVMFRVLKQITRDHRTFAMILVMPLIIMFIFGVALSGEIKNSPIVIDNNDIAINTPGGELSAATDIIEELQGDNRVDVIIGDYQDGVDGVEKSEFKASILFPSNFSESVFNSTFIANQTIVIEIYIDATKPQIQGSILAALQESIKDAFGNKGVTINQQFAYGGAEYSGLETGTPAVMGFVLTFLALLLSLLILIRERVEGTQYRLLATPLNAKERLLGYVLALTFFALLMAFSLLTISVVIFQVPVQGPFWLLISSLILFAVVNVTMAVLASNFVHNELQAVQLAPMIALPSMALSGLLVPVDTLPAVIQPLSNIIPLTYAIQVFEGIMLKGYGFNDLTYQLGILSGIGLLFTVISILTVKDRQE